MHSVTYRCLKSNVVCNAKLIRYKAMYPRCFARIRRVHGYTTYDRESLVHTIIKQSSACGKGKSKSVVWKYEGLFCKSVQADDRSCLERIITKLAQHHENNKGTLLIPFLDWLVIETNQSIIEIVVMPDIQWGMNETAETWDLKGSGSKRSSDIAKLQKDRDVCAPNWYMHGSLCGTHIHMNHTDPLKCALFNDADFLAREHVMDYSLMITWQKAQFPGAHQAMIRYADVKRPCRTVWLKIYVIDFLQTWNVRKCAERVVHWFKMHRNPSAVNPAYYRDRFNDFCGHLLQPPFSC